MARARKKRRSKKKRPARKKSIHIPLQVLERRLGELNGIVKKRGGDAYTG